MAEMKRYEIENNLSSVFPLLDPKDVPSEDYNSQAKEAAQHPNEIQLLGDLNTDYPNSTLINDIGFKDVQRDEELVKIEIAIQAVIFFLAVVGNLFVLLVLRYRKKKTSRWHWFIMHLSIADLMVAFFNILPQLAWDVTFRFKGNDFMCRIVKFMQVMVIYLSTYILVMTAVDRHRAICYPITNYASNPRRVKIMIGIAWGMSLVLSLPQVFIFRLTEVHPGSGVYDCWAHFQPEWTLTAYITTFGLSVYIIPFFILIILYGRICYTVWMNLGYKECGSQCKASSCVGIVYKFNGTGHISVIGQSDNTRTGINTTNTAVNTLTCHDHVMRTGNGTLAPDSRRHIYHGISTSKMKTIKLTFVVILAYLICWSPFMIVQMWWAYDENAPANSSTFVICLLLSSLNSCCNPWIYMAFSGSLLRQILPCCRGRPRARQQIPLQRPRANSIDQLQPQPQKSSSSNRNPCGMMDLQDKGQQQQQQQQHDSSGSGSSRKQINNHNGLSNTSTTKTTAGFMAYGNINSTNKNTSDNEMYEMKVRNANREDNDVYVRQNRVTRNQFYGNNHPCVLYRPLHTDEVTVKFHSV